MNLYNLVLMIPDFNTIELEVELKNGTYVHDFVNRQNGNDKTHWFKYNGDVLQVKSIKAVDYNKYKIKIKEVFENESDV